jgi:uncharacterized protein YceK
MLKYRSLGQVSTGETISTDQGAPASGTVSAVVSSEGVGQKERLKLAQILFDFDPQHCWGSRDLYQLDLGTSAWMWVPRCADV